MLRHVQGQNSFNFLVGFHRALDYSTHTAACHACLCECSRSCIQAKVECYHEVLNAKACQCDI